MKRLIYFFAALIFIASTAHAATVEILTPKLTPGQTLIVKFDQEPTHITFNGKTLAVFPYQTGWRAIMPLALTSSVGTKTLITEFGSSTNSQTIRVVSRIPRIIVLPVPAKLNQTPKQLVQNLTTTNASIKTSIQTISDVTRFSAPFGLPLLNNRTVSSPFGEIRQTGTEKINHLGTDFIMPKGSIVVAINSGVVTKAYLDPVYGNSIFIDHGRGIYTLYLHLDSMRVKVGDTVKKGAIIGTLGETGLADAPHLHLSIKINGTSVDPLQFVGSFR